MIWLLFRQFWETLGDFLFHHLVTLDGTEKDTEDMSMLKRKRKRWVQPYSRFDNGFGYIRLIREASLMIDDYNLLYQNFSFGMLGL